MARGSEVFEEVAQAWHGFVGRFERAQGGEVGPVAGDDGLFFAEAALKGAILRRLGVSVVVMEEEEEEAIGAEAMAYMGQDHLAVFGQVDVGLEGMRADVDGGFEGSHGVFGVFGFEAAVRYGLGDGGAAGGLFGESPCR